jgi:hypothetical protein
MTFSANDVIPFSSFSFVQYKHGEPEWLSQYSDGLWAGRSGFDSWKGYEIFLYSTASRPPLGPTQPPVQWVPRALSLGVKRPEHEVYHSPTSHAEVKNGGAGPPLAHTSLLVLN